MNLISEQISKIRSEIDQACIKAERDSSKVKLLAVSKTKPIEAIEAAIGAGQTAFGENYAQEGAEKIAYFQNRGITDLEWHFIGPLQSNKTKLIAEHFDWVESIDRDKIARRLSEQRPNELEPLQVCIQVNISREASKSGCLPADVYELAKVIARQPNLKLRGLMAVPVALSDSGDTRIQLEQLQNQYQALQGLMTNLQKEYPQVDTLSAGMTNDMELAIQYGTTQVRIGTAIFGARDYSNSDKNVESNTESNKDSNKE